MEDWPFALFRSLGAADAPLADEVEEAAVAAGAGGAAAAFGAAVDASVDESAAAAAALAARAARFFADLDIGWEEGVCDSVALASQHRSRADGHAINEINLGNIISSDLIPSTMKTYCSAVESMISSSSSSS